MRKFLIVGVLFMGGCNLPWLINEQRIDNVETRMDKVEVELEKQFPEFKPAEVTPPETGGSGIGGLAGLWNAIPIPEPYKTGGTGLFGLLAIIFGRRKKKNGTS